jgi:hypothetical protein
MLEEMATVGDESIVSWQPHGKAFRVHQPDVFARTVMLRYFKQTKYKSFQRQLHIYGFHRISKGIDRGAYFHSMFIRNKKSMSLQMSCQKIKGGRKSSNAVHHHTAVGPDYYSSDNTVDHARYQDRLNLMNVLQADPIQSDPILQACATIKEKKRGCSKRGPVTVFSTGSSDHHLDDLNSALIFNQEVSGGPSPSHELIGSEIALVSWMDQAQTILSRDEEQASPQHGYDSSASEKGHAVSALLRGVNHQKHCEDEGFFAGKRFFYVVETNDNATLEFISAGLG